MRSYNNCVMVILGASLAMAAMAAGQTPSAINVNGRATTRVSPEILRLSMVITAEGPDVRQAVEKLKKQRQDLGEQLAQAGAAEGSIHFGDAFEGTDPTMSAKQQKMRMQMQRGGPRRPPSTQPEPLKVSSVVSAQWSIKGTSGDDLMIAATELRDKISKLVSKPAAAKTPEEEEAAEEQAMMQGPQGEAGGEEPNFEFVHVLSEKEQAALYTQAMADAYAQAALLAVTTGKPHGEVVSITNVGADMQRSYYGNPYYDNPYYGGYSPTTALEALSKPKQPEAVGQQVNYVVAGEQLAVSFKIAGDR